MTVSEDNFLYWYDLPHRSLFSRQEIILNFSYSNTKLKKNTKNIIDGQDLNELKNLSKGKDTKSIGYSNLRINRTENRIFIQSEEGVLVFGTYHSSRF